MLSVLKTRAIAGVLLRSNDLGRGSAVVETPKLITAAKRRVGGTQVSLTQERGGVGGLDMEDEWDEAVEALGELKDFAFENQVGLSLTFKNNTKVTK